MIKQKHIAIIISHLLFCVICFAQEEKVDRLKKALKGLKDSARIDCLNALAEEYIWKNARDSAKKFVQQAYQEAENIHYVHGTAEAISIKVNILFNNEPFLEIEKLLNQSMSLYRKTQNKRRLNRTYFRLGWTFHAQSKFEAAIRSFDTCYHLSKNAEDSTFMFNAIWSSFHVYLESGKYKEAFQKMNEIHFFVSNSNYPAGKLMESRLLAELYKQLEDYKTALSIIQLHPPPSDISDYINRAELFSNTKQFDSAWYYYQLIDTVNHRGRFRFYLASIGKYYLLQKRYDYAMQYLTRSLNYHRRVGDSNQIMAVSNDIANTYLKLQNKDSAYQYALEVLSIAENTASRLVKRDSYQILYSIHAGWHNKDSAFYYYKKFVAIKDSIESEQLSAKLVAYDYNKKIELLDKEKEVQRRKLENESYAKNTLIAGIIVIFLLSTFIVRNIILKRRNEKLLLTHDLELQKMESERTKTELEHQATELEMHALRAQMNPHFIFNSLNSINRFILQNNKVHASEYLTKFSRLVRLILQNSQAALIPLESELESLQLYLELEAVRFDHHFEFSIKVEQELDVSSVKVPPLIIQPYAENAIWHGLMHKEDKGHLEIEMFEQDNLLWCKITDDGIGRKKAAELKSKSASTHKSMGMRITADRIAILQQKTQSDTSIKIIDLVLPDGSAGGTEVLLKIPIQYD